MNSPLPLLFVIAAIVVLGVTGNLFSPSPIVITVQVAAIVLNLWARASFQNGTFRVTAGPSADLLLTRGPYKFVRHPMYFAALAFIWAGILSHVSALTLAIGVAVTGVCIARVIVEERLLRAKYPEYSEYARSTRALIPLLF
jgi:protein-S-isoprenylcysteine O-methyltransferase Ste14